MRPNIAVALGGSNHRQQPFHCRIVKNANGTAGGSQVEHQPCASALHHERNPSVVPACRRVKLCLWETQCNQNHRQTANTMRSGPAAKSPNPTQEAPSCGAGHPRVTRNLVWVNSLIPECVRRPQL